MAPRVSNNWGSINDPELDRLTAIARTTFEPDARDAALAKVHERLVDEAMFVFLVHEVVPARCPYALQAFLRPTVIISTGRSLT